MQKQTEDGAVACPPWRVAFGDFENWVGFIKSKLDARFVCSFVDLSSVRLDDFDAVVPLQIPHYAPLMRRAELRGLKFFHPSCETVSLCDDKLQLNQFLIRQGLARLVPSLRPYGAPYPYVRKKRHGWWGVQCQIVTGPEDESDLDLSDDEWFAQELVPGPIEFATHILRVAGEIRYVSTFAYTMATDASVKGMRNAPIRTRFVPGCAYIDLFSDILGRLEFEGTACIDYKFVNGRPVLFEINPRFGYSLTSDINNYLDAYLRSLARPQAEDENRHSSAQANDIDARHLTPRRSDKRTG